MFVPAVLFLISELYLVMQQFGSLQLTNQNIYSFKKYIKFIYENIKFFTRKYWQNFFNLQPIWLNIFYSQFLFPRQQFIIYLRATFIHIATLHSYRFYTSISPSIIISLAHNIKCTESLNTSSDHKYVLRENKCCVI